jgi:hypothetical protein
MWFLYILGLCAMLVLECCHKYSSELRRPEEVNRLHNCHGFCELLVIINIQLLDAYSMLRLVLFRLWALGWRVYCGGRSYRVRLGGQGGSFHLRELNHADSAKVGAL